MVKFGTGGWRAIIGEEFTKENIQKLTLAMCLKMKAEHKDTKSVVIGYDRRFLSKEAVIWACQILGKEVKFFQDFPLFSITVCKVPGTFRNFPGSRSLFRSFSGL